MYDLDDSAAMSLLILYLLSPEKWIVRRVESVECHDDSSARRRVSLDFYMPDEAPRVGDGSVLIPLALMEKRALINLDVSDEYGHPLPVMSAAVSNKIGRVALLEFADAAGSTLRKEGLTALVERVCCSAEGGASSAVEVLKSSVSSDSDSDAVSEFCSLVDLFDRAFLLVAEVHEHATERRIIKFEYDSLFSIVPASSAIEKVRRFMGWEGLPVAFDIPSIGMGGSYHFEVMSPPDVEITEGLLVGVKLRQEDPPGPEILPELVFGGSPRLHLNTNRADIDNNAAEAWVTFRTARGPWLSNASAATFAIAVALAVSVLMIPHLQSGGGSSAGVYPIVSLLVVLPGVMGALLVRPPSHAIAARILRGPRMVMLLVGGFAYVAAWALLAVGVEDVRWIWEDLAIASALGTVAVVVAFRFPSLKGPIRYSIKEQG